jgi:hypothetical protein
MKTWYRINHTNTSGFTLVEIGRTLNGGSMTKKHFIKLADELIKVREEFKFRYSSDAFEEMVDIAVRFCRGQNSRFDSGRFRGYVNGECGPNGGIRKSE